MLILPIATVDDPNQQQTERIDGDVAFASADLFTGIVASFFASHFRGLHTLTVDNGRCWSRFLPRLPANLLSQLVVNLFP